MVKFNDKTITEFDVYTTRLRDIKMLTVVKATVTYAFALPGM